MDEMKTISKHWVDDMVMAILMNHSGDGHIDGHEELTEFIEFLLLNNFKLIK
jgi:hypothetical protein